MIKVTLCPGWECEQELFEFLFTVSGQALSWGLVTLTKLEQLLKRSRPKKAHWMDFTNKSVFFFPTVTTLEKIESRLRFDYDSIMIQ